MSDNPFGTKVSLDQNPDVFEADVGEDAGAFNIPEGHYPAYLSELEKGYSNAGNPMWIWDFTIKGGQYEGRKFRCYTAITPAAMWKLNEVLIALGLGEPGKQAKFAKKDAIGRLCIIDLEDDTYEGTKRSSVKHVLPNPSAIGAKVQVGSDIPA